MQIKIKKVKGQVMMGAVLMFMVISLIFVMSLSTSVYREIGLMKNSSTSISSYFTAESILEDVLYRVINNIPVSESEVITLNNGSATATITTLNGTKEIKSVGDNLSSIRKIKISLTEGTGTSFNYGVQVGEGGLIMENISSVTGNVYSNGPVKGYNWSIVRGDIISAGSSGLADGAYSTANIYSNTIKNSTVFGDAYYQNISSTMVFGNSYPNSPDQATSTLPISDGDIETLKLSAEAGGVISSPCPYTIESSVTIGPVKIECDLVIKNWPTITLGGNIWVEGDIIIKDGPQIRIPSSFGNQSIAIIADNESDRENSSKIEIENLPMFWSDSGNSYIVLISQNESAENGGSKEAIEVENWVFGDLLVYAGHGEILLKNLVNIKEVTGYKVKLKNWATIQYETGLADILFSGGPGGGFSVDEWGEVE